MSVLMNEPHTRPRRDHANHASHARRRGYTAVEVLSAMTLFAIGAAGVVGMQRVTIQGGEDARRFDMASNIAHEWTARLQKDSAFWTQPNATFPTVTNIGNTRWLQFVTTCNTNFCNPPAATPEAGLSGSFDTFGRDLPATSTAATYCAQYRLDWIIDPGVAPALRQNALIRAEVRVFWARLDRMPVGDCSAATPDAANANELYHFVYATTSIREYPQR
jgi:prepilin-type N-terminal cleavage/methylation domain-containing protein